MKARSNPRGGMNMGTIALIGAGIYAWQKGLLDKWLKPSGAAPDYTPQPTPGPNPEPVELPPPDYAPQPTPSPGAQPVDPPPQTLPPSSWPPPGPRPVDPPVQTLPPPTPSPRPAPAPAPAPKPAPRPVDPPVVTIQRGGPRGDDPRQPTWEELLHALRQGKMREGADPVATIREMNIAHARAEGRPEAQVRVAFSWPMTMVMWLGISEIPDKSFAGAFDFAVQKGWLSRTGPWAEPPGADERIGTLAQALWAVYDYSHARTLKNAAGGQPWFAWTAMWWAWNPPDIDGDFPDYNDLRGGVYRYAQWCLDAWGGGQRLAEIRPPDPGRLG